MMVPQLMNRFSVTGKRFLLRKIFLCELQENCEKNFNKVLTGGGISDILSKCVWVDYATGARRRDEAGDCAGCGGNFRGACPGPGWGCNRAVEKSSTAYIA